MTPGRLMAFVAAWLAACAHGAATAPPASEAERAPDEVLDLLAAWVAFAGMEDRSAVRELYLPGFEFREASAGGEPERGVDRTRHLVVCGDPEMWAVDGGYDVEMWVQTLGTDRLLRAGVRRLEMRRADGALGVASDFFDVRDEREPPEPLRWPPSCQGRREPGCGEFTMEPRTQRRIEYPRRSQPPSE